MLHRKKILFIGGSYNQSTMMFAISQYLKHYECYFTPHYCDGVLDLFAKAGMLDFTPIGGIHKKVTEEFFSRMGVAVDYKGLLYDYDLVVTCSDLIIQKNIRTKKIVLVQEGMTDPENLMYHLVRTLRLPRFLASTSTNGLSDSYEMFCVASQGYKDFFVRKGVRPEKIAVTGIPNYDDLARHTENNFPHHHFVLVATSDARETYKLDNRKKFIRKCVAIAAGRPLIFKLHPNENFARAKREIETYAPGSKVYTDGDTMAMIANCDVLITQYSTVVYAGIVFGKEVHSYFDHDTLHQMAPMQNGGDSARRIALICESVLHRSPKSNGKTRYPALLSSGRSVYAKAVKRLASIMNKTLISCTS
ncbi:hypothetical protein L6Q79_03940 [bacterium]|nr:hypothetical protein [bacterium]NUN44310.1 hypothetical protein [bacterium]